MVCRYFDADISDWYEKLLKANENMTEDDMDPDLRLCKGLQLMKQCNFTCFEDVQVNTVGLQGASCTFVGYPTETGVGSMFAQFGNALAISSSCVDKEAAWQFVRLFFMPDYQEQLKGSVFPTNLSVFEDMKQEAMSTESELTFSPVLFTYFPSTILTTTATATITSDTAE